MKDIELLLKIQEDINTQLTETLENIQQGVVDFTALSSIEIAENQYTDTLHRIIEQQK